MRQVERHGRTEMVRVNVPVPVPDGDGDQGWAQPVSEGNHSCVVRCQVTLMSSGLVQRHHVTALPTSDLLSSLHIDKFGGEVQALQLLANFI